MGGGGDDSGYERRQAEIEAKKTEARRRLNATFGEGDPAAIDRARFTTTIPVTESRYTYNNGTGDAEMGGGMVDYVVPGGGTTSFDQAGYDAALAENAAIKGNKAARESLYGTVRTDAFNAGKRGLDESREKAARDLRFELFAKGLAGGSEDVNQNALLGRTYDQGILDLGAKADAASTSLRSSDETTRLNLLQGIDNGMDQGSVLSSAANQLANNSKAAAAEAQGTSLGDLFAQAGLLNQRSQYSQGKAAGTDWWNSLGQSSTTGSRKAATGIISQA